MITAIDLVRLRNAEFLQFGATFSGLIVANNPTVLNVETQHTTFKLKLDEMAELFMLEKASPLTQELLLLDERRDKAIAGLTALVNSLCSHYDAAVARAAALLVDNLNLYGSGVARLNTQAETSSINGIINDWETKPELVTACSLLGQAGWLAELKTANQLFEQKYILRTQAYGAANPNTLKSKREEVMGAYYELRNFIEAYSVINPGATYEKLINELNALVGQYIELLNSRPVEQVPEPAPTIN